MEDKGGPTWILGQTNGIVYGILFLGCHDGDGCLGVAFNAQWEDVAVTAAQIADWNLRQRYVKAFVDETGKTVLEMDLNLRHGITVENFEDSVQRWNGGTP
jgi:Putative bacterial sensory transduction regulator